MSCIFLTLVEMARIHAKKMAKLEAEKKINLQERAEAFKTAFQEDLEYYRAHGHPDRKKFFKSVFSFV